MAIYRNVHISFWEDAKVVDNFTPEDKYFMLYCLTNSHTNICGCYEISFKQMSNELGYDKDTVEKLIDRFKNVHKVLDYDKDSKELFIKNWYKYNWTSSQKLEKAVIDNINKIKSNNFKKEIIKIYNSRDSLSIVYPYPMDRTDPDTVSDTDIYSNIIINIINYLNNKLNSNYRTNNKTTIKHIKARIKEGYSYNDFVNVIDKKYNEWYNTKMQQYLRPETLFGTKFESYLQQNSKKNTPKWFDKQIDQDLASTEEITKLEQRIKQRNN